MIPPKALNMKIMRSSGYLGSERMHCQKTLNGPRTVLNGFSSKAVGHFCWKTHNQLKVVTGNCRKFQIGVMGVRS